MERIYLCPTDKKYACSWEGQAEDIFEHFAQEHDDLLLQEDNVLKLDINEGSENRLMFYKNEIYLIQTKFVEGDFRILLRFLGLTKIANTITYNVVLRAEETKDEITDLCHKDGAIVVNTKALPGDKVECTFNITGPEESDDEPTPEKIDVVDEHEEHDSVGDQLDFKFEKKPFTRTQSLNIDQRKCGVVKRNPSLNISNTSPTPVCSNCSLKLLPPVYLCEELHDVCSDCSRTRTCCSLCDKGITQERNKVMEAKCRELMYRCKYSYKGCIESHPYQDIIKHETNCGFCDYTCTIEDCNFSGSLGKIKEHFRTLHGSIKMHEVLIVKFPKNSTMFLAHEKGVFYCESFDNQQAGLTWRVRFCGPNGRKYHMKLLFDKAKEGKYMIKKENQVYELTLTWDEAKKMKVKNKSPTLDILLF